MFFAGFNGFIAYPLNTTLSSIGASNVTTLFSFAFVQYGLVIINHNSLARFNSFSSLMSTKTLNRICFIFYLLPLVVFIPVYEAWSQKATRGELLNTSEWNKNVFKPMTLVLILVTEVVATISDVLLLRSVLKIRDSFILAHQQSSVVTSMARTKKISKIQSVSSDLITNYVVTWSFLLLDIVVKILIIQGYALLFDSIISILTIALRARSNILYGLNMKKIFEKTQVHTVHTSKGVLSPVLLQSPPPHANNPLKITNIMVSNSIISNSNFSNSTL